MELEDDAWWCCREVVEVGELLSLLEDAGGGARCWLDMMWTILQSREATATRMKRGQRTRRMEVTSTTLNCGPLIVQEARNSAAATVLGRSTLTAEQHFIHPLFFRLAIQCYV